MTRSDLDSLIYDRISSKTVAGSLSPEDEGVAMQAIANYIDTIILELPPPLPLNLEAVLGAGHTVFEGEIELQGETLVDALVVTQKTVFFSMGMMGKTDSGDQVLDMMPQPGCGYDVRFVLPAKESDTHILAVHDDILLNDMQNVSYDFGRTAAHTSATLNTAFPSVPPNFKVFCPSITGGGRVYYKVSGLWLSSAVASVV